MELKEITRQEAAEKMDLMYFECGCGYHFALDGTFPDEVGFVCPACGAVHSIEECECGGTRINNKCEICDND